MVNDLHIETCVVRLKDSEEKRKTYYVSYYTLGFYDNLYNLTKYIVYTLLYGKNGGLTFFVFSIMGYNWFHTTLSIEEPDDQTMYIVFILLS